MRGNYTTPFSRYIEAEYNKKANEFTLNEINEAISNFIIKNHREDR